MRIFNEVVIIPTSKINKDYNICLFADIHCNKCAGYKLWDALIKTTKQQEPDYIVIPGDLIYNADDILDKKNIEKMEYLFVNLSLIAPLYISLGNHDLKKGKTAKPQDTLKFLKSLESLGDIHILNNESIDLGEITITGFSPRYESYYVKYKDKWLDFFIEDLLNSNFSFHDDKYNIFLTHSPEIISDGKLLSISNKNLLQYLDLILCGHMHNGLVPRWMEKLKIIKKDGGIAFSEGDSFKEIRARIIKKCRGTFDVSNAKMVVTRGIRKEPDPQFSLLDKISAKDMTTIKLIKK